MYNINSYLSIKNKTFYCVITYYVNGKRKIKWISTDIKETASRKKAEKRRIEIRDKFIADYNPLNENKDSNVANKEENITFADYMVKWLDKIKHQIAEFTYAGYKRTIEGRIYKYFSETNILLIDLKPVHILDFYNHLYNEGLKGTTINHYHANIRKALDYATKTDLIVSNPATKIDKPKEEQFIASPYTEEELNKLFSAVSQTNIELLIYLSTFYGLRRSEVSGLKWDAIDFDNKTITIKHTVTKGTTKEGANTIIAKDKTKNKSSYRTLPLIEDIESLLLQKKNKIEYYKSLFKKSYINDFKEYVCVNDIGELFKPDYITHRFVSLLKKYNLRRIRFHDLRHSCATLLVKKGIPLREIQEWLGHSSSKTTERCTHLDSSSKIKSATVIENSLILDIKKDILECTPNIS